MIRQRQHGLREGRVEVAILDPAVADNDKIAHPSGRRRRLLGKTQRHLVAGIHDHVAIVNLRQQLAHIAVARVVTDQIAPALLGAHNLIVVRHFRRARTWPGSRSPNSRDSADRRPRDPASAFSPARRIALRPLDAVPINFQIRPQAHAARRSRPKNIRQIEEDRFLASRRKTEVRLRRDPSAVSVGNFNAHAMRVPAISLRDGHVQRRFGVVNRALRDQIERTALRRIVAQIDFNIMIARDSLILAAAKRSRAPVRRAC